MMFSTWLDNLALHAVILLLAIALDRVLPEPPARVHPVVWIGQVVAALARAAPQQPAAAFLFGCGIVVLVVGGSGALAWLVMTTLATFGPIPYAAGGAVLLRTAFAVRGLSSAAHQTRLALDDDRLDAARTSLRNLVSRDSMSLTPPLIAGAAIESVAENTTDSYVGPWLAFAVLGVPGAIAYRTVNTLDSMLGYRGAYEYLGKAAARLDDLVNLVPARLSALLMLLGSALSRPAARRGWLIMLRDRGRTASPNAGLTMSAMAGLLGTRLEKPGHYCLGAGLREPKAGDIGRAVRIAERTAVLAVAVALALLVARYAVTG